MLHSPKVASTATPHIPITHARLATNVPNSQISYVNPSLPSTKDVPLLTVRRDWGPWHSAVRTLILNANLSQMTLSLAQFSTQDFGLHTLPLSTRDLHMLNYSLSPNGGPAMV